MVTSGNSRYRFPVSLARGLTTAGEIAGTGVSPNPVGASLLDLLQRQSRRERGCAGEPEVALVATVVVRGQSCPDPASNHPDGNVTEAGHGRVWGVDSCRAR
jgi:hypothetical protein